MPLVLLCLLDDHLLMLLSHSGTFTNFALFNDAQRITATVLLLVLKVQRPCSIEYGQEVLSKEINEMIEPVK